MVVQRCLLAVSSVAMTGIGEVRLLDGQFHHLPFPRRSLLDQ